MRQYIDAALNDSLRALEDLRANTETLKQLELAGRSMAACFQRNGHIYSCGNGGSLCDAMHFAEELSGRFRNDRPALGAAAIADPSHMSCTGNDYGFDQVFSRYVEGHGRTGDILLAISTSGKSRNVILAAEAARAKDMEVITLTGRPDSPLGRLATIDICTPAPTSYADRVQELHIKCIHILIELCERQLFA